MLESSSGFDAALGLTGVAALTASTPARTSPVVHVVQRLSFGIRPGDLAEATEKGIDHWVDEQLHPDGIDDSLVEEVFPGFEPPGFLGIFR